jgi:hypothetical protein
LWIRPAGKMAVAPSRSWDRRKWTLQGEILITR